MPRRIFRVLRILARGLATAPDLRWPSLTPMLDALEREHDTQASLPGGATGAPTC